MRNDLALLCAALCAAVTTCAQELPGSRFDQGTPAVKGILERLNAKGAGIKPAAFSFANALPEVGPQDAPPPPDQQSYVDRFRAIEADLLEWQQRCDAAPSGSDEEAEARRWRDQAVQAGRELAAQQDWLATYPSATLEDFAKEAAQKYQSASSGSPAESFYKSFIDPAWTAYEQSAEREISATGHWRKVVDWANYENDRYQAASSGSRQESAYLTVRDLAWQQAPKTLERQLSAAWGSYRYFENMAAEFDNGYQAAQSGSSQETFYNQARRLAYDAAYREAQRAIAADPRPEALQPLADEYYNRQAAAQSGSPAAEYFGKVQDLIRRFLQP